MAGQAQGEPTERRLSNTRPRDALGRPLPWDAVGAEMVPEREFIDSSDAIDEAIDYLQRGLPFHAHEVLEQRWRCAPEAEREWWRGLAQAAAGVTQAARGNEVGAQRLLARADATLADTSPPADLADSTTSLLIHHIWSP